MAQRKGTKVKAGAALKRTARMIGPRSENVRAVLYLKPKHLDALEELAQEQAKAIGALRPDLSKAARSVFEQWLAKR